MNLPMPAETGKMVREPLTGRWLGEDGHFVSDPDLAIVFDTWNEASSAVRNLSKTRLELVLKLHHDYEVLQVFN